MKQQKSATIVAFFCVLSLLGLPGAASAALTGIIEEEVVTWDATHVVLINGSGAVLESWKGDGMPGDTVDLQALKIQPQRLKFNYARDEFQVRWWPDSSTSGRRMVLFLKNSSRPRVLFNHRKWKAASQFDMDCSTVWLERNGVFGRKTTSFYGPGTPGVTNFAKESDFRQIVQKTLVVQQKLHRALSEPNPTRRAWKVLPLTNQPSPVVRQRCLQAMVRLRGAALPALKYLLNAPRTRSSRSDIIRALAGAGGSRSAPDLLRFVQAEMVYWRNETRKLGPGWRKQNTFDEKYDPRLERSYALNAALYELARIGDTRSKPTAKAVLTWWRSHPILHETGNPYGIEESCLRILGQSDYAS